jgi:rare lipoprotein A
MNLKTSVGVALLAAASSGALVAAVVHGLAPAVEADVRFSKSPATFAPAVPGDALEPVLAERQREARQQSRHSLEVVRGVASWYGGVFNGRTTASGEPFDMNALTACHPTLPFGSLVRVINLSNMQSVVVTITDRGDLVEERRIIDLSYGAAQKLSMTQQGLAKVELQVLSHGGRHGKS